MRTSPLDPELLAHRALMATDKDALARHSGHYLPRTLAVGAGPSAPCPVCLFLEMCTEYLGEVAANVWLDPPRCRDLPDGSPHLADRFGETDSSAGFACPDAAGGEVAPPPVPRTTERSGIETEHPSTKKENVLEEAERIIN